MTRPKQRIRNYNTSDAQMLEFARLIQGYLVADKGAFADLDPEFDNTFADNMLAAVNKAEDFSSDYQLIDVLAQKTLDVNAEMTKCRQCYQLAKYFINKAFDGHPGIKNEFGYNDYFRARSSKDKMIQFMLDLHETAQKYSIELVAAGFGQDKIDEIKERADKLQNANMAPERAKGVRSAATDKRIFLLNKVWNYTQRVRKAAKLIYHDDWGKWQLFNLPWKGSRHRHKQELNGTVSFDETVSLTFPDFDKDSVLTITNTGIVPLRFCGSKKKGQNCAETGWILQPEDSLVVEMSDISPENTVVNFLNISNIVAKYGRLTGEYSVIKVD